MSDMQKDGRAIFRGVKKTIEILQTVTSQGNSQPKNIKVVQLLASVAVSPKTQQVQDETWFMLEKVRIDTAGQTWLHGWRSNDIVVLGYAHGHVRFEQVNVDAMSHQPVVFEEDQGQHLV